MPLSINVRKAKRMIFVTMADVHLTICTLELVGWTIVCIDNHIYELVLHLWKAIGVNGAISYTHRRPRNLLGERSTQKITALKICCQHICSHVMRV